MFMPVAQPQVACLDGDRGNGRRGVNTLRQVSKSTLTPQAHDLGSHLSSFQANQIQKLKLPQHDVTLVS